MNINDTLLTMLKEANHTNYPIEKIEVFLQNKCDFLERQKIAIDIIEEIMDVHGKKSLLKSVTELAHVEYKIRELEPWVRDHVVHALLSFLLGVYLNEKHLKLQYGVKVPCFQWKLAGLFHDVGYPAEIGKNVIKPYVDNINKIKKEIGVDVRDLKATIQIDGIEKLTNDRNSFDLIQRRLNDWELKINAKQTYEKMTNSGEICHGMIGSLSILYIIDLLYQKHNEKREYNTIFIPGTGIDVNQEYFEIDVVSACSAIFIHNLPNEYFKQAKINPKKAPVAYLLKLADCLQGWERPSSNSKSGVSADKFQITTLNEFNANIPESKKLEMKNDIFSSLLVENFRIV
jgi:hypothetical protein